MQRLRRLARQSSARRAEAAFVTEGAKVLAEAVRAGVVVESVYLDVAAAGEEEMALARRCEEAGARIFELEAGVLARVGDTVTPQPIVAVVRSVELSLVELGRRSPDLVVVCVKVRDPGNAGAVLRSAEAAGAGGVVCCDGSVDLFNPKTVRASAGAVFHVPVVGGGDASGVLDTLRSWGLRTHGAVARGGSDYLAVDLAGPAALVLGNEAHGLPEELGPRLDDLVTIPLAGRSESLNVGMAAAILCFEVVRQRRPAATVGGHR